MWKTIGHKILGSAILIKKAIRVSNFCKRDSYTCTENNI